MLVQNDLISQLQARYQSFSKSQKLIATYIIENYDRAAFITASRMGQTVGVSESTVVRFAYSVGYDGYPELQRALQELIRNKLTSMQRIQLTSDLPRSDVLKTVLKYDMQNIRMTIDAIDNIAFEGAVNALVNANNIYVIGMRNAYPIAQFLSYNLSFICGCVVSVNTTLFNACEQMAHTGEGDVCVAISFPRYSNRTVDAIEFAHSLGATTIALTDSNSSPLIPFATYPLTARSDMVPFTDSLVAPLSLINAIIVAVGLMRKEYLAEHFSRLENIWDRQKIYVKSTVPMRPQEDK
ncbi:MAG: MurR/RpiR family transcriptional regulator [Clostridiales bacterium]|jgi:DNA-binding MurR/RpiR family transcriptional regulator|nr:MurR/RpiR family transcriptional regulator [Clostridiales bacterium]